MKIRHIFDGMAAAALICLSIWAVPSHAQTGPRKTSPPTVYNMLYRYLNTSQNCPTWSGGTQEYNANAASYPEAWCTGIILRATTPQKEPNGAWVPEAKSLANSGRVSAGGMSFSYIRDDAKFFRLAFTYTNGFTIYPLMGKYAAPADKLKYTILCFFPVDGATDDRSDHGCGVQSAMANTTGNVVGGPIGASCQDQKAVTVAPSLQPGDTPEVTASKKFDAAKQTARNWYDKAFAYNNNADPVTRGYQYACGFDMRDGKRGVADFTAALLAASPTNLLSYAGTDVNELRIQTWGTDDATAAKLPIESFFYITGHSDGRSNAQFDQKLYNQKTGLFVPIVEITLPPEVGGQFKFAYHSADQVVAVPQDLPPHPTCTPGDFDKTC